MDQFEYVVQVEEEYGYREWLWVPNMTIDELRVWWQKLPTVAPFFFDGPVSFPGEIHQIYFHTPTTFSFVEEGEGRVVTPLHSDPITLPKDALYMHIHEDEDSFLRIGEEHVEHAGYVSSEEAYSEDYEPPGEVKEAWDKALYEDIAKRFGVEKDNSVNCYFCSVLVDERDCIGADDYNGGDGGSMCAECADKQVDKDTE